jgi:hypothetical protein
MEKTVMSLYNKGLLTKEVLDTVMEPYKGTDCDSGGSQNIQAFDGKGVKEVICFVMSPEKYKDAIEHPMIKDGDDEFNLKMYNLFESIWRGQWGCW